MRGSNVVRRKKMCAPMSIPAGCVRRRGETRPPTREVKAMPKVRVHNVTISLDGFVAGTNQRLDAPFGDGVGWGDELHSWFISAMEDTAAGKTGIDVDYFVRGDQNIGATIMGRNMFGPQRGPWEDESWKGWWGDNPPYHHDVFVHTHHLRPALEMAGGTVFHFTDEPVETVLQRAFDAADG
jgi:dihydrofolate reductase